MVSAKEHTQPMKGNIPVPTAYFLLRQLIGDNTTDIKAR